MSGDPRESAEPPVQEVSPQVRPAGGSACCPIVSRLTSRPTGGVRVAPAGRAPPGARHPGGDPRPDLLEAGGLRAGLVPGPAGHPAPGPASGSPRPRPTGTRTRPSTCPREGADFPRGPGQGRWGGASLPHPGRHAHRLGPVRGQENQPERERNRRVVLRQGAPARRQRQALAAPGGSRCGSPTRCPAAPMT